MGISLDQFNVLMSPLNPARVSKRKQGGKELSYVEAWEIKAHLTRLFGFGNWDSEVLEYNFVASRDYQSQNGSDMVEVIYNCRLRLTVRDPDGKFLCTYTEAAAGSTSGPASMLGEHHDNAIKSAESDALKRCAINLGSQFGLSLYDNGSTREVIRKVVVTPEGYMPPQPDAEALARVQQSLGAQEVNMTGQQEEQ